MNLHCPTDPTAQIARFGADLAAKLAGTGRNDDLAADIADARHVERDAFKPVLVAEGRRLYADLGGDPDTGEIEDRLVAFAEETADRLADAPPVVSGFQVLLAQFAHQIAATAHAGSRK